MTRRVVFVLVLAVLCVAAANGALAADAAEAADRADKPPRLPRPLAELVRAVSLVLIGLAFGAVVLVVRTVLPWVARLTDASVERMSAKRLVLCGMLPVLGLGLLGPGLEKLDIPALANTVGLVVFLPAAVLAMAGLCAGLPYLGRAVLRSEREPTPLGAALAGGLVLGLAAISTAWEVMAAVTGFLVVSWCLGIGLGTLIGAGRGGPEA